MQFTDERSLQAKTQAQIDIINERFGMRLKNANARPFGGLEKACSRNSWLGRLEDQGFTVFSSRPDGSSHEDPQRYLERRMAEAFVLFGGDRKAFSEFLRNLRRWAGRNATPAEIMIAISAGPSWREILPRKRSQCAPPAPVVSILAPGFYPDLCAPLASKMRRLKRFSWVLSFGSCALGVVFSATPAPSVRPEALGWDSVRLTVKSKAPVAYRERDGKRFAIVLPSAPVCVRQESQASDNSWFWVLWAHRTGKGVPVKL